MKKICWAIEHRNKLVNEPYDFSKPIHTALFRTRRHALVWLEDNPYWARLKAKPIKVKVTITEV